MKIIIGNAVHDENGRSTNGKRGDQLQKGTDDYSGEVKLQDFYMSKKGWHILRPKKVQLAKTMALLMKAACNNKNIGYSQNDRDSITRLGIDTKVPANCDCSSLVGEVIREASGKPIPDFYTGNEVSVLEKTGLFYDPIDYRAGVTLYTGDVIVTKTKGHTAIVVEGMPRTNPYKEPDVNVTSKANAKATGCREYIYKGEGVQWVQYELCRQGYQSEIDDAGGIDGSCGKATVKCIKDFQEKKGLEVDGICGKNTRRALKK
jgi:Putative peptidoglycan-binding domain-containing protein